MHRGRGQACGGRTAIAWGRPGALGAGRIQARRPRASGGNARPLTQALLLLEGRRGTCCRMKPRVCGDWGQQALTEVRVPGDAGKSHF